MLLLLALLLSTSVPPTLGVVVVAQSTSTNSTSCLGGGDSPPFVPSNFSVAVVKPIFTATPYSQYAYGSFYAFYKKYAGATGNITTDLGWLNTSVKSGTGYNSGWGHSLPIYDFLTSAAARSCGLVLGRNLHVVSDINVTDGALFSASGSRRFDAAVIGHQEYVTQAEYDQLRLFVASGGRLIAMSSDEFYAKVKFNATTLAETFVIGHGGYVFDGRTAWYEKPFPIPWNTSGWFGSTYCCFKRFNYSGAVVNATNPVGRELEQYFGGTVFVGYQSHEENAVSNLTDTSVVATFLRQSGVEVASYVHRYGRGAVFCLCVFGEDLIGLDRPTQLFLIASVTAALPGENPSKVQGPGPPAFPYAAVAGALALTGVMASIIILLRRSRAPGDHGGATSDGGSPPPFQK